MSETDRRGLLLVVNSLGVGGAEKQVVTLLNHLDTRRFRLHLAYIKRDERLLPQLDSSRLDEVLCCDVRSGIEREGVRRLRRLIRDRSIDAVVCTNMYSTLYGTLATFGLRPRPKLVAVLHTTTLSTYGEKIRLPLYRRIFRRCDLMIYVCSNQRDHWHKRDLTSRRDAVVHNGIDVQHFSQRPDTQRTLQLRASLGFGPQEYVVGLCSALRPEKAHGDILRAIASLRDRGTRVAAMFIGDGPERAVIESMVDELELRDRVRITGIQQDVRPFIASCDVMTLVSRGETFSLAALESMALGKPLVMSDTGGASEQVVHGQNGFLFEPGDIETLATHLASLTSPALRAQMGARSAERVRRLFTVEQMTEGFSDRISELFQPESPAVARAAAP
jgi:glycosyltransferase involved in cell wall biosynthesis